MSGISPSEFKTFKDNPLVKEIYPGIFLHKNFLPNYVNYKYHSELELRKDEWNKHGNYEVGDHEEFGNLYDWKDKLSFDFNLDYLKLNIVNTIAPIYWIFNHTNFIRLQTGDSAPLSVSYEDMNMMYAKPEYKLCYYLGNWTGGGLVFPKINFEFNPEEGDLLIFSPDREYVHFTKEVTSGTRYCYIDVLNYHSGYFIG
jgi:hypothetical protein